MKLSEYIAEQLALMATAAELTQEYIDQIEANTASIVVIEEKLDTLMGET